MKKLAIYFFFLLISSTAGTSVIAQVRYGVKAGLNSSSIGWFSSGYGLKVGYQFGLTTDIGLSNRFSIQPALLISSKGVVYKSENQNPSTYLTLNYLEVPILALYKHQLKNGSKLFVGLGPYMGIGISGYSKSKGQDRWEVAFDRNRKPNFQSFVPFDFGVSASSGIEISKFSFGVNYNKGVKTILSASNNYNNTLSLTAAYFIN